MKCPSCNSDRHAVKGGPDSQTQIHDAMNQVYRIRRCKACGNDWVTIEIDRVELQRLRALAHRTVMADARG